jgi:hypothetical protein
MGLVLSVRPGYAFFVGQRRIVVAVEKKPAQVNDRTGRWPHMRRRKSHVDIGV